MKYISSFDIFDTCLVRKCGTPENFFDVFSLRAFNHEPPEWARQEFVAARRIAERKAGEINPSYTLQDIWTKFEWEYPFLKTKMEIVRLEQDLEREMLMPVLEMRDKVNACRKHGDKIIFISDMYLSSEFLISAMRGCGFYQDGDSLYVSCECKARKSDGNLFHYVREKEGLKSYHHWHHYGDNKIGDFMVPRELGIKCTLINHEYTPYQKQWKDNDYSLGFKYPSILAGIGRALHYSTEWTTHTDFVLDIIAPFYCSLVYRMMKDAQQSGIKRLYFCARDAYMMYKIALLYKQLFPAIECKFLYISRKALYEGDDEAKIAYYEQIGLATKNDYVGIVDIRSSGKTLIQINKILKSHGCKPIRGYYYMLYSDGGDGIDYLINDAYYEVSQRYNSKLASINNRFCVLFERFFPLNNLSKTKGYKANSNGDIKPVFCTEADVDIESESEIIEDIKHWSKIHEELISIFTISYIQLYLYQYSDYIFNISINTIYHFLEKPAKSYLMALQCLSIHYTYPNLHILPFVSKLSFIQIIKTRGKHTGWKMGTLVLSNYEKIYNLFSKIKAELKLRDII